MKCPRPLALRSVMAPHGKPMTCGIQSNPEPTSPAALQSRHHPRPGSPITTRARGGKAAQCEEEERTVEFGSVGCIIGAAADLGVGAPDPDRSVRGSV